jgi:transcriptional regulator with XRE-family HTH domain
MTKNYGEKLRAMRKDAGLSQWAVAKKTGLKNGQLVSNWERGLCWLPAKKAKLISKLYRVNLETLHKIHMKEMSKHVAEKMGL